MNDNTGFHSPAAREGVGEGDRRGAGICEDRRRRIVAIKVEDIYIFDNVNVLIQEKQGADRAMKQLSSCLLGF